MVFIDQLKKEHVVFHELLSDIDSMRGKQFDLEDFEGLFLKLYTLWDVHEKKEEKNFTKITRVDISKYVAKVLEDHNELRPYKENIHEALQEKDPEKVKVALNKNFEWLRDKLEEHFTYEESYLFTKLEGYSDEELGIADASS